MAYGTRAMADVVSRHIGYVPVNEAYAGAVRGQLPVAVFTDEAAALRRIRAQ